MNLYILLKKILPERFYNKLKREKIKYKKKERKKHREEITTENFKNLIDDLGIINNDDILVHSSLTNFPKIQGGSKTIYDIIRNKIGDGTILVPTFPFNGFMETYFEENKIFDADQRNSKMGVFTEYVRNLDYSIRSLSPSHPVSANGINSKFYISDHFLDDTPFSTNSPFLKLADKRGKILLIGVGLNSTTNFHVYEDLLGENCPLKVYLDKKFFFEVKNKDFTYNGYYKVHDSKMSQIRNCEIVRDEFLKNNIMKVIKVKNSEISVIDAYKMNICLLDLLYDGISIYGKIDLNDKDKENIQKLKESI